MSNSKSRFVDQKGQWQNTTSTAVKKKQAKLEKAMSNKKKGKK